ncbi:hypothetical protein Q4E93_22560 [Flavitalea sp. BT771]|uniref:hypothetical protein n=1 Tax=Flavitalea sp. BT771 TaxID=3063329 RepID=UPI0026E284B6|nr:hypothetical protein [Flavitalea sp. BT771]MDO6433412.1 hypothetical protein [Flavitalea sp. BT771]MDV6222683.1 hypothetical protein [Flavitalea sp. BT771]
MVAKSLIDLTRDLLSSGVFDHLPDNEIARLRWMIMQGQREDQLPLQPLFSYWYRGDFYSPNVSPHLLQQCNEYLQRMGQPLLDAYGQELYEA